MMMTQARTVTIVVPEIVRLPPASFKDGSVTTFVKDFVSAPNNNSAAFCKSL